jgi:hypothetical protein
MIVSQISGVDAHTCCDIVARYCPLSELQAFSWRNFYCPETRWNAVPFCKAQRLLRILLETLEHSDEYYSTKIPSLKH